MLLMLDLQALTPQREGVRTELKWYRGGTFFQAGFLGVLWSASSPAWLGTEKTECSHSRQARPRVTAEIQDTYETPKNGMEGERS